MKVYCPNQFQKQLVAGWQPDGIQNTAFKQVPDPLIKKKSPHTFTLINIKTIQDK